MYIHTLVIMYTFQLLYVQKIIFLNNDDFDSNNNNNDKPSSLYHVIHM